MSDRTGAAVLEAHALRTATVTAALLHGSRRSPRELTRPLRAVVVSLVLGAALLVAVVAAVRIQAALAQRHAADRAAVVETSRVS
jgi:hypothetical protein